MLSLDVRSTRRKLRGQRNIPKTCSRGLSTGQEACTWGATTAYMLPEGDILPDLPLRTLDLSAAHESSITSNDVFVDVCVLEPLDCRIRHTVVVRCWFYETVSIFTLQVDPRYGDFHYDNTVLTYTHLWISSLMPQTEKALSAAAPCGEPAGLNRGAPSASASSCNNCLLSR